MGMMIYKSTVEARDGTLVPVFTDDKTMFSRYAPLKEVENFVSNTTCDDAGDFQGGFFVIAGLGNGIHIKSLRKRFPDSFILVVENSDDDILWLKKNFNLCEVLSMENLCVTNISHAVEVFRNAYNPLLHGNFIFLPVRSWVNQIPKKSEALRHSLEQTISSIAGDYSTQAYFGKIWFRNFFLNLKEMINIPALTNTIKPQDFVGAFVAAAGPSLEKNIPDLQNSNIRKKIYLIATDTALPVLLRHQIIPDMTVTIDGQTSSARHFLQKIPNSMILAADLTSNSNVVKRCINFECPIFFFRNKNPLSLILDDFLKESGFKGIPEINTGAGTVTAAAVDIARKIGFTQIQIGGGDFAYIQGKPYCRGTYFEDLFCNNSLRINPTEQRYIGLTYRRKTTTKEGKTVTTILEEYNKYFQQYIKNYPEICFITDSERVNTSFKGIYNNKFSLDFFHLPQQQIIDFFQWYETLLEEGNKKVIFSILPLFAWYMKKNNGKCDIFHIMKLAYSLMVRYTGTYGK